MADVAQFSNYQDQPGAATPVRLVTADGADFYTAAGGASGGGAPLGYQQITTLTTAQTLTVPAGANLALIAAEAVDIRWRDDGTAPTASVGMQLFLGAPQTFSGDLAALKFIQTAAGSILNVSYYS